MSMNNYILNLLNIEDKNIFILPNIKKDTTPTKCNIFPKYNSYFLQ